MQVVSLLSTQLPFYLPTLLVQKRLCKEASVSIMICTHICTYIQVCMAPILSTVSIDRLIQHTPHLSIGKSSAEKVAKPCCFKTQILVACANPNSKWDVHKQGVWGHIGHEGKPEEVWHIEEVLETWCGPCQAHTYSPCTFAFPSPES